MEIVTKKKNLKTRHFITYVWPNFARNRFIVTYGCQLKNSSQCIPTISVTFFFVFFSKTLFWFVEVTRIYALVTPEMRIFCPMALFAVYPRNTSNSYMISNKKKNKKKTFVVSSTRIPMLEAIKNINRPRYSIILHSAPIEATLVGYFVCRLIITNKNIAYY